MYIEAELCIGCGACQVYCPVGAITVAENKAVINLEKCVECSTCKRVNVCPTQAINQQQIEWPRILRSFFSDPNCPHKGTTLTYGRGTAEMKSNDVTGRYKRGMAGFAIEMGRPGIGTALREVEKVAMGIATLGVTFEDKNPLTSLMIDPTSGKIQDDVLDETILSTIIEFSVPKERISEALQKIDALSKEINTVFSLAMVTRAEPDGSLPNVEIVRNSGYAVSPNAKVNVGLGRPLFTEEGDNNDTCSA